jgi:hypothetical protein
MQYVPPQIILTNSMMYHTTTILLFRPFGALKQIAGIPATPWELCTSSANSMVSLLRLYRSRFGLRYIVNLSVHMLFTASIVHLVNATSTNESVQRSSKKALRFCVLGFSEIGMVWPAAVKSLRVVESLQAKWRLQSEREDSSSPSLQNPHATFPDNIPTTVPTAAPNYPRDINKPVHAEELDQLFIPSQTQNLMHCVEPDNNLGNQGPGFWEYLPIWDLGQEGQNGQFQTGQFHGVN